jgi:hypothetical protein
MKKIFFRKKGIFYEVYIQRYNNLLHKSTLLENLYVEIIAKIGNWTAYNSA